MAEFLNKYIVYCEIGGFKVAVHVAAPSPEEALGQFEALFEEIKGKVEKVRLADEASGYFIRGFS